MSIGRLVVSELGTTLRLSYVVVSELLPRLKGALGLRARGIQTDQHAAEFYAEAKDGDLFVGLFGINH